VEDIKTPVLASPTTGLKLFVCFPHAGWFSEETSPLISSQPPQFITTSTRTTRKAKHIVPRIIKLIVDSDVSILLLSAKKINYFNLIPDININVFTHYSSLPQSTIWFFSHLGLTTGFVTRVTG
jgi:hypothetical protein